MEKDSPTIPDTDVLSRGAEIFRAKLIRVFHLLDCIGEQMIQKEVPKFYTTEIVHSRRRIRLMTTSPHGLVKFQVYSNKDTRWGADFTDRRVQRVKNRNSSYPGVDVWAHWVVKSVWFQNSILALIIMNSIVLGIQAEVADERGKRVERVRLVLHIFDYCSLFIFVLEVILKWTDNFRHYWRNNWNIFDFAVTFLSLVPELMHIFSGNLGMKRSSDVSRVAENLRSFRILRSLKMVSRFEKVRLIVLAVTKALMAMIFISVLLVVFAYIFAIIGVIFFSAALYKNRAKLEFWDSFSSIPRALITLFQLFTLDHWLNVFKDVTLVNNYGFSIAYIMIWIVIGSFIFRNIFIGIMVNNFQVIRSDLSSDMASMQEEERQVMEMEKFTSVLDQKRKVSVGSDESKLGAKSMTSIGQPVENAEESVHRQKSEVWQRMVENNLENLARGDKSVCWPRDSLFRYFCMMEALMENLEERSQLIALLSQSLIHIHDT